MATADFPFDVINMDDPATVEALKNQYLNYIANQGQLTNQPSIAYPKPTPTPKNYLPGGVLPANLMGAYGYGSAIDVTPGSAYQTPAQLGALGDMMGAYAGMYGADAAANAQLGVAGINANAGISIADIQAALGKYQANAALQGNNYNADKTLAGIKDTNSANMYGYDQNLAGIKDTNATNLGLGQLNLQGQLGTAYLQNVPKLDMLGQVLGTNGGTGTGTGTGTGGLGSGAVDATGTAQAPVVPNFQSFNDVLLKQKMGQQAATINKAYDTQANQMTNNLASRGFSTNSPGFQSMLAQNNSNRIGDLMSSQRDLTSAQAQYNAQNALPYAQLGLNQYNAQADRNLRLQLANNANKQGLIQGLLI